MRIGAPMPTRTVGPRWPSCCAAVAAADWLALPTRSPPAPPVATEPSPPTTLSSTVSRFRGPDPAPLASAAQAQPAVTRPSEASEIIHALQLRPSAIEPGTPYARVADAVIASDARVAEAMAHMVNLTRQANAMYMLQNIRARR